jgi:hypothetical protein
MRRIVRDMADAGHQLLDAVEHAVQQARLLAELAARTVHAHAASMSPRMSSVSKC